jgi:uncharacterized Zn-binding protein involved in type VI secretion
MGMVERAVRVTDGVAHTGTDYAFAMSFAVLATGVVLVPFGVGSVMMYASASALALEMGGHIDKLSDKDIEEQVQNGSHTVFIGVGNERAAKASPATTLSRDVSDWVCQGSDTVFIELCNASRVGAKTTCDGQVITGEETVFYGGEQVMAPGAVIGEEKVGGEAFGWYSFAVTWTPYGSLPTSKLGAAVYVVGAATDAGLTHDYVDYGLDVKEGASYAKTLTRAIRSLVR